MHRDVKASLRHKRTVRSFDDDESDETIIGLGFVDPKAAAEAGASGQPLTKGS